jgi:hypothetical protein
MFEFRKRFIEHLPFGEFGQFFKDFNFAHGGNLARLRFYCKRSDSERY